MFAWQYQAYSLGWAPGTVAFIFWLTLVLQLGRRHLLDTRSLHAKVETFIACRSGILET